MSLDQRMDKESVVHLHNGVLHGRKKWHLELCRQMDGARKHHFESNNSDPERQLSHALSHKWLLKIKQKKSPEITIPENLASNEDPKRDINGSNLHGK